ncbi:MAG: biotin/lipoyl-containing protein [Planctomycetota bacterium]|nr:biotin/lipoyl-containing protein [Planctomycetota bacterium]
MNSVIAQSRRWTPRTRNFEVGRPRHSWPILLLTCILFALISGPSAAEESSDRAFAQLYTVQPLSSEYLPLRLQGRIDNRAPVTHRPPQADLSVKWFRPEGEAVAEGERLVVFETMKQEMEIEQLKKGIDVEELDLSLSRSKTDQELTALRQKKADFLAQKKVHTAAIQASRKKDQQTLDIARLEVKSAKESLENLAHTLERIRGLHLSGFTTRQAIREAQDAFDKAREALRLPELKLEIEEADTGYSRRKYHQMQLRKLLVELGNEEHQEGVFRELAALEELQRMRDTIKSEKLSRLNLWQREREDVVEKNFVPAKGSGTLSYVNDREQRMHHGAKLRPMFFAFVLEGDEMVVHIELREEWRDLVKPSTAENPNEGLAEIRIPALGGETFKGRVLSVASMPQESWRDKTRKGFNCTVRLEKPEERLKAGMRVECDILIPLAESAVVVPKWLITDLRQPGVVMANGDERSVQGFVVGPDFVVTSGIQSGDRLRLSHRESSSSRARISGIVAASEFFTIKIKQHWYYEITDLIPDGTDVKKDQVVARLELRYRDADYEKLRIETSAVTANSQYTIEQINAETERIKAYVEWRKAIVDAEQERLNHIFERYVSYEVESTKAEIELKNAQIGLKNLESKLKDLTDPQFRETMSENQIRDLELKLAVAKANNRKAILSRIAALRKRDWLTVWDAQERMWAAQEKANRKRTLYSIGREAYRVKLSKAYVEFQEELNKQDSRRLLVGQEVIRAPREGRVFLWQNRWKGVPKVGERVYDEILFTMPIGRGRQFDLEVPVRYYNRFKVGQQIEFTAPALGQSPRQGTIRRIAPGFTRSRTEEEEHFVRGTVGLSEKVFRMVVEFQLSEEESEKGTPGITAYVDL